MLSKIMIQNQRNMIQKIYFLRYSSSHIPVENENENEKLQVVAEKKKESLIQQMISGAKSDGKVEKSAKEQIQRMLEISRPEWKRMVGASATLGLSVGCNLFFPFGLKLLIDSLVPGASVAYSMTEIGAGIGASMVLGLFASYWRLALLGTAMENITMSIRTKLFSKIL